MMRFFLTLLLALAIFSSGCSEDSNLFRVWGEPCYVTSDGTMYVGPDAFQFERGQCVLGKTVEGSGGEVLCSGWIPATYEACDGIDNNCNGIVDDPDLLTIDSWDPDNQCESCGKCAGTVEACVDGHWTCLYPYGPPMPDTNCDGIDDDCDCRTDEEFNNGELVFCYTHEDPATALCGECGVGYESCENGRLSCVGERHPRDEICDGLDNNCNCIIDDTDVEQSKADIVFMIDTSGSMALTIDTVTNSVCSFALADNSDETYMFGLILIATPDRDYSLAQNIGTAQQLCDALQEIIVQGGVEPTLSANLAAADVSENSLMIDWREGARKVLVGFGDEYAQAKDCYSPLDPALTIQQCLNSIAVEVMSLCADNKVSVFWFNSYAEYYQDIAYACSGNFYFLQSNETYLISSLNQMFEELCVEPSN